MMVLTYIIFGITTILILVYLIYPVFLLALSSGKRQRDSHNPMIDNVSVVLLTYNGKDYLDDKIKSLLSEINTFQHKELIIIDDNSTDNGIEIVKSYENTENVKLVLKPEHKGIPHTMNLAVGIASYENIVFCDQRQSISKGIIRDLVIGLQEKDVGAVSSCISGYGTSRHCSFIRRHENFLKTCESKSGNLIGVYGPLYSIKKKYYYPIPENIILDDLYLSLMILKSAQIKLINKCRIFEADNDVLYNYSRTRKYLSGFFQILGSGKLISGLGLKKITMLLWHKYLRLLLPFLFFLSYLLVGIIAFKQFAYLIAFIFVSLVIILSLLPGKNIRVSRLKNIVRISIFYFVAFWDIMFFKILSLAKKDKPVDNIGNLKFEK